MLETVSSFNDTEGSFLEQHLANPGLHHRLIIPEVDLALHTVFPTRFVRFTSFPYLRVSSASVVLSYPIPQTFLLQMSRMYTLLLVSILSAVSLAVPYRLTRHMSPVLVKRISTQFDDQVSASGSFSKVY